MDALWRPLKRARASISGPVQTTDKENTAAAVPATQGHAPDRRKRAQSLGGPLHSQLHKEELSPRKKARRSLVPGRSILKAPAGPVKPFGPFFAPDEAQTTSFSQTQELISSQETVAAASSSQQSEDRRKSLARRVSFCNRVTMREFEKDQVQPGDSSMADSSPDRNEPQQPENDLSSSVIIHADQPGNQSPLKGQRYSDLFEESMDMAGDDVTGAFGAAMNASNLADEAPMSFVDDSSDPTDEQDMSVVQDPHATTSAFAQNTVILNQSQRRESNASLQSEESEASQLALGSGDEYETPLGPPGVSYSDQSSSPHVQSIPEQDGDADQEDDDDDSGMDLDASMDDNGLVVSDGLTSRRISVGGTLRRGSIAPGQAALAMLDAVDEDTQEYPDSSVTATQEHPMSEDSDDNTVDMDQDVTFKHNYEDPSQPRVSLNAQQDTPARRVSLAPPQPSRSPGRAPRSPARSPGRAFRPALPISDNRPAARASIAATTTRIPQPPSFQAKPAPRQSEPIKIEPNVKARFIDPVPTATFEAHQPEEQHASNPESTPEAEPQENEPQVAQSSEDEADAPGVVSPIPENEAAIGLEEFFELCGVKFMDDVFTGGKPQSRKSIAQPDHTATPKSRATLADQIYAMSCSSHDLNTFSTMSKELRKAMEENGEWLDDVDSMVQEEMPEIFRRYMEAESEEKAAMETIFKTAKSFYRTDVRNEWYAYKQTAMQDSCTAFDAHQQGLDQDLDIVRKTSAALIEIQPELEARQVELQKQLDQERARENEIAESDQEQLAGLREAIAEQETQVNDFARDQADVDAQLERVKAKIAEMTAEKEEHQRAIQEAQRIRDGAGFTSTEQVANLQDRISTLEGLHGWKVLEYNASELKLLYLNEICVILLLTPNGVERAQLSLYRELNHRTDELVAIKAFLFDRLKVFIEGEASNYGPAPAFLQRISSIWTSAETLLQEIKMVKRRYPITVHLVSKKSRPAPFLRIAARIHCQKAASAFVVMFELTGEEITQVDDQHIVGEVGCSVEPKYGQLDCTELSYIVRDFVSNGHSGALLAGCEAAEAKME